MLRTPFGRFSALWSVVADFDDFRECYHVCDIREFYIPLNADDDREGLGIRRIERLASRIRKYASDVKLYMMITSGCLNDHHPDCLESKMSGCYGLTIFSTE